MKHSGRRSFIKKGLLGAAGLASSPTASAAIAAKDADHGTTPRCKLGMVTYELGKSWDIATLIANCTVAGFEAVELRTTHRHGVEISLPKEQRLEVKKRFAESPVRLLSLGTMCAYHYADRAMVDQNIEETKRWCELAHDLGCLGVKVRPNGFVKDVPEEKTLAQIGNSLERCGDAARDNGVEIWVEVHGQRTEEPSNMLRIMELAGSPLVGICWNSSDTDVANGSVMQAFDMLKPWLRNCHINELWRTPSPWGTKLGHPQEETNKGFPSYFRPYPYREFFQLLRAAGYDRYTLAEVPESAEPVRFMRYYRALWEQLV
jgi:sugar phosphate isomerase/epimerase